MEYRTPSNFILTSKKLQRWVYNATHNAINFLNENGALDKGLSDFVQNTIDNNDKQAAKELIGEFNLVLV